MTPHRMARWICVWIKGSAPLRQRAIWSILGEVHDEAAGLAAIDQRAVDQLNIGGFLSFGRLNIRMRAGVGRSSVTRPKSSTANLRSPIVRISRAYERVGAFGSLAGGLVGNGISFFAIRHMTLPQITETQSAIFAHARR